MKKWWYWLIQTGIWILAAILNLFEQRSGIVVGFNAFAAMLFAILGISQYLCDKKGEKGARIFKYICIAAIAALVAVLTAVILLARR